MIEEILGEQCARDVFLASVASGLLNEKQAAHLNDLMEKDAKIDVLAYLKGVGKGIGGAFGLASGATEKGFKALSKVPSSLMWTAILGGGIGALGATGYDAIKERLTSEDPEAKYNAEVEAMYINKKRELEDAKWMTRVREMRDDLRRNHKKMSNEEYTKKYNDLVKALDERA